MPCTPKNNLLFKLQLVAMIVASKTILQNKTILFCFDFDKTTFGKLHSIFTFDEGICHKGSEIYGCVTIICRWQFVQSTTRINHIESRVIPQFIWYNLRLSGYNYFCLPFPTDYFGELFCVNLPTFNVEFLKWFFCVDENFS